MVGHACACIYVNDNLRLHPVPILRRLRLPQFATLPVDEHWFFTTFKKTLGENFFIVIIFSSQYCYNITSHAAEVKHIENIAKFF